MFTQRRASVIFFLRPSVSRRLFSCVCFSRLPQQFIVVENESLLFFFFFSWSSHIFSNSCFVACLVEKVLTWFHFFLYSNALSLTQSLSLCIWCMYVRVCLSIAKQYFVHTAEPLCVSVDDEDGDPSHTLFFFFSLSLYTYTYMCVSFATY